MDNGVVQENLVVQLLEVSTVLDKFDHLLDVLHTGVILKVQKGREVLKYFVMELIF